MWLIDQLYKTVKLGLQDSDSCPISKLGPAHEFNGFWKLKCYCEFECHQLDSFDHKLELSIINTFLLQILLDRRAWLTPQKSKELKRKQKLSYNLIASQSFSQSSLNAGYMCADLFHSNEAKLQILDLRALLTPHRSSKQKNSDITVKFDCLFVWKTHNFFFVWSSLHADHVRVDSSH